MNVTGKQPAPPLSVVHVVDSLNPGGMENGVVNMARQLAPRGINTHVACLRERGSFADKLPDPLAVTVLGKQAGFSKGSLVALARLIRQQRPAVLHTHNLGPLIYASLATLGGCTVPILHGEHGQIQPQDLSLRRLATRRLLYHCCHTVHTVSGSLLDSLRGLQMKSRRMTAITNGVDCDTFNPAESRSRAREALGLPSGVGATLGIVGRFVALKRHRMLLEALVPVMQAHPQVHLVVVGDHGPERETIIAAMQEHPYHDRIHWLGMRSDMAACYQAMDLLVSPSEVEGLSNAVLEAMACGVPVLAHRACGNNEAIVSGSGGYLHDLPDAGSLARALDGILEEPSVLIEQGELARKRAVEHFSIAAMAGGSLRLYREIAGRG